MMRTFLCQWIMAFHLDPSGIGQQVLLLRGAVVRT